MNTHSCPKCGLHSSTPLTCDVCRAVATMNNLSEHEVGLTATKVFTDQPFQYWYEQCFRCHRPFGVTEASGDLPPGLCVLLPLGFTPGGRKDRRDLSPMGLLPPEKPGHSVVCGHCLAQERSHVGDAEFRKRHPMEDTRGD